MEEVGIDLAALCWHSAEALAVINEQNRPVYLNPALRHLLQVAEGPTALLPAPVVALLRLPTDLPIGQPRQVVRPFQKGAATQSLSLYFLPCRDASAKLSFTIVYVTTPQPHPAAQLALDSILPQRLHRWQAEQKRRWGFHALPAQTPAMQRVLRQVQRAIHSREPVALVGEAGVGKLSLARTIFWQGQTGKELLYILDCRALPAAVQAEQLFGQPEFGRTGTTKRGILTGSKTGTLILQGVASLAAPWQRRLLQFFNPTNPTSPESAAKSGEITTQTVHAPDEEILQYIENLPPPTKASRSEENADFSPVAPASAATWRLIVTERLPLEMAVRTGRLDEDLYYYLSTFVIQVPPLRERKSELADCAAWILTQPTEPKVAMATSSGQPEGKPAATKPRLSCPTLASDCVDVLLRYPWPGNLRELEAVLHAAQQRSDGLLLRLDDLPQRFRTPTGTMPISDPGATVAGLTSGTGNLASATPRGSDNLPHSLDQIIETVERRLFRLALQRFRGNKSRAAEFLGVSRARFLRRWEQLQLSEKE